MSRVRAAVLEEAGRRLQVEELELEPPGPGEVMVRLAAAGVCHSDLHVIEGDLPVPLPAVLGHEGAGVVEAVGEGVTRVRPGDHVVLSWIPGCGRCYYCRIGRPELCDEAARLQVAGTLPGGALRLRRPGGAPVHHFLEVSCFAEATVVPERGVIPVRPDVPLDRAALVGCAVTTGWGAVVHTAGVRPGSSVAVVGTGGVGLNVVQAAALSGAWPVIAVDRVPAKLELARQFGATHTVDASRTSDVIGAVVDLTEGRGADYAFEVVGRPETIASAYGMARKGGTVVVVGVAAPHLEVGINAFSLPSQSKVLTGSWYGRSVPEVDIPHILDLYMAGRLKLDELISRRYRLEEANEAFDALRAGEVARGVLLLGG
ncbi:MAG: Zn-dependent alcohol dehydrogenase [Clostridia bacterium]|nr:Zn-dependent alcohol dehydrogenase [Clostridia bacterium]MCL6522573.1 Zn-dependent alcohol dehydrogenase [Bacillota bacterium]